MQKKLHGLVGNAVRFESASSQRQTAVGKPLAGSSKYSLPCSLPVHRGGWGSEYK